MPALELASVHEAGALGDEAGAAGGTPTATVVVVQEAARKSRRGGRGSTDSGVDKVAKTSGGKNEYECRFCFMKFEKSQALGGHMNRHRQEREKEQFQHAQQIVSSVAQQQIPRTWSSVSGDMIQSPSGAGGNSATMPSRLSSHLSGGATRPQYVAPPISFGTSYKSTSPANCNLGTQLPSSAAPNCSYYLSSNASSSNNNMQNQHNQQQLQQWIGSIDGFSNAASNSPRSIPNNGSSSFHHHHPVEYNMTSSLQAASLPSEFLANVLRNSGLPNDGNSVQVCPSTPMSSQALGAYDVIYNSQLPNAFYNGGL